MGEKSGILGAAKSHPVLSIGAGVVAFAASIIQIVDSPTFSHFLGISEAETASGSGDPAPLTVEHASKGTGDLRIREDMKPVASAAGGPAVSMAAEGNSAQRNLVGAIEAGVRRDIASAAPGLSEVRVAIVLDSLEFAGNVRQANFSYAIESGGVSGSCAAAIKFGSNSELSRKLAQRVAQTITGSTNKGEVLCA